MKKPRGDAKLKTLPAEQQAALFLLLQQKRADEVKALIAKDPGVQTSTGALSEFYHWYPLSRRLEQAANFADQLKEQLKKLPDLDLDAEKLSAVAQMAFEARAVQEQDSELFIALRKRRQKDTELMLKAENQAMRIKQFEENSAKAKAKLEGLKSKGGLSAETLKQIEEAAAIL